MKVHGYAAQKAKDPLVPYAFERRAPGDHDVVIDIQYCGVCHSDVHQVNNEWSGNSIFPMVPGHEIIGVVSQVGPKSTRYKIGDRVGVGCFVDSCRKCTSCLDGQEQYCIDGGATLTYNDLERDESKTPTRGGYSNKIVVNENYVLRIPDNLASDRTAPLLCAGITLYSPLVHWKAGPDKKVAIVGMGGLGHIGVKMANALGAEVTVLSHSLIKYDDGKKMGAANFYSTNDPKTFEIFQGYFDLIINTVSVELDLNKYLNLLALDGTMVIVGLPEKETQISAFPLVNARRSLAGSAVGGIKETQEMLDFCSKNDIVCDIELIHINQVNDAYRRILDSDVRYRFVIDLKTLATGN